MQVVIDIPEDVLKRTVFYREFRDLNDCITIIKALEKATPLPKVHGRLIDADELLKAIDTWDKFGYTTGRNLIRLNPDNKDMYEAYIHFDDSVSCIKNMPTIIPADTEESE